jgi:CRISPR-associated protein Cas1
MPVRRLHNYAYCPRLFYYQWVENLFVENTDTAEGTAVHENVDRPSHFAEELDLADRASLRSLHLSSLELGITGVVDLLEDLGQGRELIDYKKGSPGQDASGHAVPKDNDALQIAAYALLLREHQLPVAKASIYYAEARRRVPVELSDGLFQRCVELIEEARGVAGSGLCPPPLVNDHRCLHCSAYPVCLPGESRFWAEGEPPPDTLVPPRPERLDGDVLIVQNPRAKVGRRQQRLHVTVEGEVPAEFPLAQLAMVSLFGAVQISTQAVHACLEADIPVAWFSPSGRYLGSLTGLPTSGVDARRGQYRLFEQPDLRLTLAREVVRAKIHNQRVMLMRNGAPEDADLARLATLREQTALASNLDDLRGLEGAAAAVYFGRFGTLIKAADALGFTFSGRNRRPPRDPVNALLSLAYSALVKELTGVLHAVGLDPFLGFFHAPRYGRPALALDLMEEFRPLIADSVVISLINRRELQADDFQRTSRGVWLKDSGHRQFWPAWSRRLDTEVSHPQFSYRMAYRRMLEVQVRQLWRFCRGEARGYTGFTTR